MKLVQGIMGLSQRVASSPRAMPIWCTRASRPCNMQLNVPKLPREANSVNAACNPLSNYGAQWCQNSCEKQILKARHATLSANLELNGAKIHAKNKFGNCNVHPSQQFQTPECRKYRVTDDLRWQNSGDTLVPEARRCIYMASGAIDRPVHG